MTIQESLEQEKEEEKDMNRKEPKLEVEEKNKEKLPSEKLRGLYRNQVSNAERNSIPIETKESAEEYTKQDFKDAYKKEIMNFIEPTIGKELDREDKADRKERLGQIHDFQETHSKEKMYEFKKESIQELKGLPLTERGEQRLAQSESKLDQEFHGKKEKGSHTSKVQKDKRNQEAFQQTEKQREKVEIER